MRDDKQVCALDGCSKLFAPKCRIQKYCSVKHSEAARYTKIKARADRRWKKTSGRIKVINLNNGVQFANNIIAKGVLSE